ncbi:MAG: alpha/beta hydrolase [Deltaproteobacteria bacterium]|nr:alpha/beta hydrolase [Deltaproteobacteria bacterium]
MKAAEWIASARLARWLGPWAQSTAAPTDVTRTIQKIAAKSHAERELTVWSYRPNSRTPHGSVLLLPGMHFLGPADPRLDRFSRVLASAGLHVNAVFLPDFEALTLRPTLFSDAQRALDGLYDDPTRPPGPVGVLTISFGSLVGLELALEPRNASKIASLVLFGGYGDLAQTLRFCVGGAPGAPHDPLNKCVVFLNLLEHFELSPDERNELADVWMRFVRATWGQPVLKDPTWFVPIARELAEALRPAVRALFLQTTGAEPGAMALFETTYARAEASLAWLDIRAKLHALRIPTSIIHGAEDDVIRYTQAHTLADAIAPNALRGVMITGMYGHTGSTLAGLSSLKSTAREVQTLLRALSTLVRVSSR